MLQEKTGCAMLRRVSVRCRHSSRRGRQPRAGHAAPTRRCRRRADRHRASSASVERDRLPPAHLGGLGGLAASLATTTSSSCLARKNTVDDLAMAASVGLADWIKARHGCRRDGHRRLRRLPDAGPASVRPDGIESAGGSAQGLALLPVETILTRAASGREAVRATTAGGVTFGAYDIHAGGPSVDRRGSGRRRLRR